MADDVQPEPASGREPGSSGKEAAGELPSAGHSAMPVALDLPGLVVEHSAVLYRYAYRLSGSVVDAEDLTQQTFLIAHRKLQQLRDAASVRGWLCAVLRRNYLKLQRRSGPNRLARVNLDINDIPATAAEELIVDRDVLQRAIDELPDTYKFVLLGFYFENLSYREMAERFELPVGTVMSRLARAKGFLRSRLLEREKKAARQRSTVLHGSRGEDDL